MKRTNGINQLLLCLLVVLFSQCKKTNDIEMANQVTVDAIEPAAGEAGTLVTVKGRGYSLILHEDSVKFNGVAGEIEKVTDTTIQVYAPAEGSTGLVTVMVRNKQAAGSVFTYLRGDGPYIVSISPKVGWDYSTTAVKIRGGNFGAGGNSTAVTFDNLPASVQFFSDTLLIVSPPQHEAGKVPVVVNVNEKVSNMVYYSYQQKPELLRIYQSQKGNTFYYFLAVKNLAAEDRANKVFVDEGKEVKIEAVYRKGTDEYMVEPQGDKIAIREEEVFSKTASYDIGFVVSSNGIEGNSAHFENEPRIVGITSPGKDAYHFGKEDTVTITGKYFGIKMLNSTVELWKATVPVTQLLPNPQILSWSNTEIRIIVPAYQFNYDQQIKTIALALWIRAGERSSNGHITYEIETATTEKAVVSTVAGTNNNGYKDGAGAEAMFSGLWGIAADAYGNVYVADVNNYLIRKVSTSGIVSTFAGNGHSGYADGDAALAEFGEPRGIVLDAHGNMYVADYWNNRIRKISPSGVVSTFVGSGSTGDRDGENTTAEFNKPIGIALNAQEDIYVADYGNSKVRKITPTGIVTSVAGSGESGFADGNASSALFNGPFDLVADANNTIYVADVNNNRIRKISPDGTVTTFAGNGVAGFADGPGPAAQFNTPTGITMDQQGNLYVADRNNYRIRKITPSGEVSTLTGNSNPGFADGSLEQARLFDPKGIAFDAQENALFVTDGNRIRKIILP